MGDQTLIDEEWYDERSGKRVHLYVYAPQPIKSESGHTWSCIYHLEGLYDEPRKHYQISPFLAVNDVMNKLLVDMNILKDALPVRAALLKRYHLEE